MGRFYDRDGNPLETPNDFPPHSVALQFLGTSRPSRNVQNETDADFDSNNVSGYFFEFVQEPSASGSVGTVSTLVRSFTSQVPKMVKSLLWSPSTLPWLPVPVRFLPCSPPPTLTGG